MLRHFEESAGGHRGFVILAQPRAEGVHIAAGQARERDGSGLGPASVEVVAGIEELFEQRAIGFEQGTRVGGDAVEMVECDYAQPFGRVRGVDAEQVIEPPHPPREVRSSQNPAAAQAAQPVHFRQAAGDQEVLAQMNGGARGAREGGVQIRFVHQHARTHAMRDLPGAAQDALLGQDAAGIVQISENDEPRARRHRALDLLGIDAEIILEAPRKSADARAEILGDIEQQRIGGVLDQHFIAGVEHRSHSQMIGHGGARGGDDALGLDAQARRQPVLQRQAIWEDANLRMRDSLASSMETMFNDITSGRIGQTMLKMFESLVFKMVATWAMGMAQMQNSTGHLFSGLLSLLGFRTGNALSVAVGGGGSGVGGGGTAPFIASGGDGGAFAGTNFASLSGSAADPTLLGLDLSAGGSVAAGAELPAGSTLGAGTGIAGLLSSLGSLGPIGLALGVGGALASFGGFGSPLQGALTGLVLGGSIGAILGWIFGGSHKRHKRDDIERQAFAQIKQVEDEFNLFTLDYNSAYSQLEQIRQQVSQAMHQLGTRDRMDPWIDAAEQRISATEKDRQTRLQLAFSPAEFESGGYVNPVMAGAGSFAESRAAAPFFSAAFAGRIPSLASGGAVPAIIHAGEFVMSAPAVNRIGRGTLEGMNAGSLDSGIHFHGPLIQAFDGPSVDAWLRGGGLDMLVKGLIRGRAEGAF